MTLRLILLLCIICPLFGNANSYYPNSINGLSGSELKLALGNHISQFNKIRMISGGSPSLWSIFSEIDKYENGNIWSISALSNDKYLNNFCPPENWIEEHLINPDWTGDKYPYQLDVNYDLHLIFPTVQIVVENKRNYPPFKLSEIIKECGTIQIGYSYLNNVKINAYEPADEFKGDVARAIMYAASAYHHLPWQSFGLNIIMGGEYPTLNKAAIANLLEWHRNDPVSDKEINRNNGIYKYQLNRNPFIDFPDLPEYIWGNKMGQPFSYTPDSDTDNPSIEDSECLRSQYKIADKAIVLRSKFIPLDVNWRINGVFHNSPLLYPKELGVGIHQLEFYNTTVNGQVKIEIMQ